MIGRFAAASKMVKEARALENMEDGVNLELVPVAARTHETLEDCNIYCKRCAGCHIFFSFLSGMFTYPCFLYFSYYMDGDKHEASKNAITSGLLFSASAICLAISMYFYGFELNISRQNVGSGEVSRRSSSSTVVYSAGEDISEQPTDNQTASSSGNRRILESACSSKPDAASKVREVASAISQISSETIVLKEAQKLETSKASTEHKTQSTALMTSAKGKSTESGNLSSGEIRRRKLLNLQDSTLLTSSSEEDSIAPKHMLDRIM